METDVIKMAHRAEVNMFCDTCNKEITEGEDYFYNYTTEEVCCEKCTMEITSDEEKIAYFSHASW